MNIRKTTSKEMTRDGHQNANKREMIPRKRSSSTASTLWYIVHRHREHSTRPIESSYKGDRDHSNIMNAIAD